MQAQDSAKRSVVSGQANESARVRVMAQCLLIDEDQAERQRLSRLLAGLGIDTAERPANEALAFCNDNAPDVVMLAAGSRVRMPRDFLKRMRRGLSGKQPVVIVYADRPDTDMIGRSILDGVADVIMKPFDRDLLQFKLRQAGVI
jgi:two-component system, chemotaxis family, chemotaxis protein CheY